MAFKIDLEQCAGCGVCEGACKHGAIGPDADKYSINAEKCTDCGECSDSCPMGCIIGVKK